MMIDHGHTRRARRTLTVVAVAALASGCISRPPDSVKVPVPGPAPLHTEVPASGIIELALPNGEATVSAAAIDHVEVAVEVRCATSSSRCRERAARATLVGIHRDQRMRFAMKDAPGSGAAMTFRIRVPYDRALDVRMKYGDLRIEDHADDLEVHMTAGAIELDLPEAAVGRVDLAASVGEAALSTESGHREGRRPLLVGSRVEWADGAGASSVHARVRFGDIQLKLTR
ncbi:MAG: hypothetical protein AAFU65_09490 [Pseudomonadota bacterium]